MQAHTQKKNNVHIAGNKDSDKIMVFGHGFGTNQHTFEPLLPAFEKEYKIILYDNVGGGSSDLDAYDPVRYAYLHAYAADLEAILDELAVKNVVFVGHSVSSMIGVVASIRRPELFSKLVLLSGSPRYLNDLATGYTGGFEQPALEELYASMRNNFQAWASGFAHLMTFTPEHPEIAKNFEKSLSALRPDIALSVAKAIFSSDLRKEVAKVNHPTLIVQSTADLAVPPQVGQYLHEHIKNSIYLTVNAQGHSVHQAAPNEVIAAIKSFL